MLRKLLWTGLYGAIGGDQGGGPSRAPSGPQLGPRSSGGRSRGPNPLAVVGVAAAVGIVLAKVIDWRGHAHPRR